MELSILRLFDQIELQVPNAHRIRPRRLPPGVSMASGNRTRGRNPGGSGQQLPPAALPILARGLEIDARLVVSYTDDQVQIAGR
jgi:hypothetical protein